MALTREQAEVALGDIDNFQARTRQLSDYKDAAPHFLIWGMVLAGGNFAIHFLGEWASTFWLAAGVVAAALTVGLGRWQSERRRRDPSGYVAWNTDNLRIGLTFGVVFIFGCGAVSILYPLNLKDSIALVTLFYACLFLAFGVWHGLRLGIIGMALVLLVIASYHFSMDYFHLWNGIIAAFTFIGGGLWLRRV